MTDVTQYRIRAESAADLVRTIEAAVAAGRLLPGQRLPSVRRLAEELGLSPATVAAALAELRRRGVVLTEQRRATRIGAGPPIGARRPALPVPPGAHDLSTGNPDPALLPDLSRALSRLSYSGRLYGESSLHPELAALAREQLRAEGVPCESICVVSGALDGIERVLQAHMRPGDSIAVEDPGYAALFDLLRAQGLVLEAVAVDDRGMLPVQLQQALSRGAGAVVLTPRGQNPTGAALDRARACELRAILDASPRVLVIEDDHLGGVAGAGLHSIVEGRERWAATRSVAKALGPDLRVAVLSADARTLARVEGRQQCGPGWVSGLLQALVHELWSDPHVGEQVAHASATYAHRRRVLLERLSRLGVHAHGACGLNVWVPVAEEAVVVASMLARGWVLAPGAPFRLTAAPGIRITTANLRESQAARLAADLGEVLASTGAGRSG